MTTPALPPSPACPHCGARGEPGALRCLLCHASFPEPLGAIPASEAPVSAGRAMNLGTMMLAIALIAVCLSVWQRSTGLGLPLTLASALAMVRTVRVVRRRQRDARPLTALGMTGTFLASLGLISLAAWSSLVAFLLTCVSVSAALFNTPIGDLGITIAVGISLATALFVLRLFGKIDLGDGP